MTETIPIRRCYKLNVFQYKTWFEAIGDVRTPMSFSKMRN